MPIVKKILQFIYLFSLITFITYLLCWGDDNFFDSIDLLLYSVIVLFALILILLLSNSVLYLIRIVMKKDHENINKSFKLLSFLISISFLFIGQIVFISMLSYVWPEFHLPGAFWTTLLENLKLEENQEILNAWPDPFVMFIIGVVFFCLPLVNWKKLRFKAKEGHAVGA